MMDPKIILVALSGLENILRTGEAIVKEYGGQNVYAIQVEECFGKSCLLTLLPCPAE